MRSSLRRQPLGRQKRTHLDSISASRNRISRSRRPSAAQQACGAQQHDSRLTCAEMQMMLGRCRSSGVAGVQSDSASLLAVQAGRLRPAGCASSSCRRSAAPWPNTPRSIQAESYRSFQGLRSKRSKRSLLLQMCDRASASKKIWRRWPHAINKALQMCEWTNLALTRTRIVQAHAWLWTMLCLLLPVTRAAASSWPCS